MIKILSSRYDVFIKYVELIFKIEILIFGLLTYNSLTFGQPIMSVFVWISFLLSCILFFDRLMNYKKYIRNPFIWILLAFVVSFSISSLFNYSFGLLQPAKSLVWLSISLLLLFSCDSDRGIDHYKKQLVIVSAVYNVYVFFASSISIVLLLQNYSKATILSTGHIVRRGFFWGRLWGVYTDPNYGSVLAGVSIVLTVAAIIIMKKKRLILPGIINILIQFAYISFSDSRTGMLSLTIGLGVLALGIIIRYKKRFNEEKRLLKKASSILASFALVLILPLSGMFFPTVIKKAYNAVAVSPITSTTDDLSTSHDMTIGRAPDDATSNDISNRRFDLWRSGVEVFSTSPVVGIGTEDFAAYAKIHAPKTYLVNNDYGIFGNFHNSFIDVLARQGILGILIVLIFVISVFIFIFKRLFKINNNADYLFCLALIAVVSVALVTACFVREVFYVSSAVTTLTWSGLGYVIFYLQQSVTTEKLTDSFVQEDKLEKKV